MSLLTNWGYTLTGDDVGLADLLTVGEFDAFTANKYAGDARVDSEIKAAQSRVRDYVGWHLAPSMACEFKADSISVARCVQLPARYVTGVSSVTVDGVVLDASEYFWKPNGLLWFKRRNNNVSWNDIVINYTAGLPADLLGGIKELIAHRVVHSVAQSYGIQSELAGGVQISYSTSWINGANATTLPDDNKEVLAPYRLQGVF